MLHSFKLIFDWLDHWHLAKFILIALAVSFSIVGRNINEFRTPFKKKFFATVILTIWLLMGLGLLLVVGVTLIERFQQNDLAVWLVLISVTLVGSCSCSYLTIKHLRTLYGHKEKS